MPAPQNLLRRRALTAEVQIGAFLDLGNVAAAQIAGTAGYDWCLIDAEHGVNDASSIRAQLLALATVGAQAAVRVPTNADWVIKQALDMGAQSILVPMVNSGAEAQAAAAAMRYAPTGSRGLAAGIVGASGYGHIADYMHTANDEVFLMVQAETQASVENIDAIAGTDGVDCVFVGPSDLAADMGYLGQTTHPKVMEAIAHVLRQTKAAGKAAGMFCLDPGTLKQYADMGANVIAVASDVVSFRAAMMAQAKAARDSLA